LVEAIFPKEEAMSGTAGMDQKKLEQHISQISTSWTTFAAAHGESADAAAQAQRRLLERYTPAVYRFLLKLVRDPNVADDLFQEFALRFVRGAFKGVDPQRHRFRDYLKTSLRNLVIDHQRRQRFQAQPLGDIEPAAQDAPGQEADEEFMAIWRHELLNRGLKALAAYEQETGQLLYTVLQFRMDHREMHSPKMAETLAAKVGKPVTPGWVRKRLYLAREKFGELLLEEIWQSLQEPTKEELEQELVDLNLLAYCWDALERYRSGS
jgi:RNA polymerase sigma-70 factor (ECF subfamily)